jgi:uncharacterized protein (TIGR02453 family)
MQPAFPGFPPEAMTFFRGLKKNNKREWFQQRKHIYDERVKAPMLDLVTAVNAHLAQFAPDYIVDPAKAVYRIYRDTRFSKDKTPYKTHIAASFPRRGLQKHAGAGFYFSVAPDELEFAGGVYMPGPDELRGIRNFLDGNHEEFQRIVQGRSLCKLMGELQGDSLSRVPKGFLPDHPAADLLRMKQWLFYTTDADPALATTAKLLPAIVDRFRAMTPFVEFLNRPLVAVRRREAFFAAG